MRFLLPLGAVVALLTASVVPYVRSRTEGSADGGHCLAWPAGRVEFRVNAAGDPQLGEAAFTAIGASVATWAHQMEVCGNLTLVVGQRSSSRNVGSQKQAGASNENLILFRTRDCADVPGAQACTGNGDCANTYDCWDSSPGTLAITTTTFSPVTGQLLDADTELNAASHLFTTVDGPPCADVQEPSCISIDVQNTVTHELGHSLGLAHSPDSRSTMYAGAQPGEIFKRVLDDGSKEFVCTVYPQGQTSRDCNGPQKTQASNPSCGAFPLGLLLLGGLVARRLCRRGGE